MSYCPPSTPCKTPTAKRRNSLPNGEALGLRVEYGRLGEVQPMGSGGGCVQNLYRLSAHRTAQDDAKYFLAEFFKKILGRSTKNIQPCLKVLRQKRILETKLCIKISLCCILNYWKINTLLIAKRNSHARLLKTASCERVHTEFCTLWIWKNLEMVLMKYALIPHLQCFLWSHDDCRALTVQKWVSNRSLLVRSASS